MEELAWDNKKAGDPAEKKYLEIAELVSTIGGKIRLAWYSENLELAGSV